MRTTGLDEIVKRGPHLVERLLRVVISGLLTKWGDIGRLIRLQIC